MPCKESTVEKLKGLDYWHTFSFSMLVPTAIAIVKYKTPELTENIEAPNMAIVLKMLALSICYWGIKRAV